MGSNFEFGIGISVEGVDVASKAIGGVIADVQGLQNSLVSAADIGLDQIFKGVDLSALIPANDALNNITIAISEVDEGLVEVSSSACGVTTCLEEVDSGLIEVTHTTSGWVEVLGRVPGLMSSVADQAAHIHDAAGFISASASELEYFSVRTEAALGGTRKAAMDFATAALETANRNKVSWQSAVQLQMGLRNVSVEFDSTTQAGQKQIDTMVKLTESFGMTQEEVASLAGTMKATGGNLEELAGVGVAFQTQFKVPGLLNQLPFAAKAAMDAQASFGTLVGKSSKDITANVLRMTGTYAKALGVTAAEAARKAMGTFQKFTAEVESYEDLFLGLADDFTPLQTAFLETGMGLEDLQELMRKGQEDPAAFAEEVKRIRDSMDPQMGERFFRQVLRNSDEATRALLTQEAAAKTANEATAGAGVEPDDPSATFNKIADAMRETAGDALKQQEALKGVALELGKLAASEGIRKGIQLVNGVLQETNTVLIDQWNNLRQNDVAMQAFTGTVMGATAAFNGLSLAMSLVGGVFGGASKIFFGVTSALGLLIRPVTFLIEQFKLWRGATGAVAQGAEGVAASGSRLGRIFGGLGKVFGKLLLPVGIAVAAFGNVVDAVKEIGDVLSDPSKTGMDKFKGVVGAVLGAVWGTFNDFFLGLPGKFLEGFMGAGRAVSTEGAESFGKAVGSFLGRGAQMIGEFWSTSVLPAFTGLWDNISAWFAKRSWSEILLDPLIAVVGGFAAIGDQILAFFKGIAGGILESFGVPLDALGPTFNIVWLKIEKFLVGSFLYIKDTFADALTGWQMIFGDVGTNIKIAWEGVTSGLTRAFYGFVEKTLEGLRHILQAVSENAQALGLTTETVDAGAQKLLEAQAAIAKSKRESEAATRGNIAQIEEERAARDAALAEEVIGREKARKAIADSYDSQVQDNQQKLNKLAEQQAEADAAASRRASKLPATAVAPGATPVAAPAAPSTAWPVTATTPSTVATSPAGVASATQVAQGAGSPLVVAAPAANASAAAQQAINNTLEVTVRASDALTSAIAHSINFHLSSQSETGAGIGR